MMLAAGSTAPPSTRPSAVQQRLGLSHGIEIGFGGSSHPTTAKRGISNADLNLLGFDIKAQFSTITGTHRFPSVIAYLRSGYRAGNTTLRRSGLPNEVAELQAKSVPLFIGANIYPFADLLFRAYAGPGIGIEIITLTYRERGQIVLRDRAVHPAFDAHFGLEFRPHNALSIFAEARHVWGSTRELAHTPDYTNNSFTMTIGIAGSFALKRRSRTALVQN